MEENKQEEVKQEEQPQQEQQQENQEQPQEQNQEQTEQTQEQQQVPQQSQNIKGQFNIDDYIEDDGYPISVAVVDPVIKDGVSKYILYTIKGEDKNGTFEIFRRFSEFHALRQIMVTRWPGIFIPPIPPKKATGNFDQDFIEERREFFEIFLKEMAKQKYLWYSDEFSIFLRTQNPDIEKALNSLSKLYLEDIIQKYQGVFKLLQGKLLDQELELKISAFNLFLKRIREQLEKYKQMVKQLIGVRKMHNQEFDKFMTFLLPQYELTCLKEYVGNIVEGKYVFAEANDPKLHQILQNIRELAAGNQFQSMLTLLKAEIYEIEAFLEAIETMYQYEQQQKSEQYKIKGYEKDLQKAQEGKTSALKSMFSNKSNDQRVQEESLKIDLHTGILDKVNQILDLIKVIIGYVMIDRFKSEKVKQYYTTLQSIAQYESDFAKQKADLWQYVLENDNIANICTSNVE